MDSLSARVVILKQKEASLKRRECSSRPTIDLVNCPSILENLFINDSKTFLKKYFKRHPVVCRGDKKCVQVLNNVLFDLDVTELIQNSASEKTHIWLSQRDSDGALESISVHDHSQAVKLYKAGHSIYCRAPEELEKKVVPKLLNDLGLGITGSGTDRYRRGEIEVFISRKGHNTDFHTDFQENFTIQISGTKKWIFRNSTAVTPLRACAPHFQTMADGDKEETLGLNQCDSELSEQQLKVLRLGDPNFSADQHLKNVPRSDSAAEECVTLKPGDVLYHPAGIWHRVECEKDSISINISLIVASYAEIFCAGLQQMLWENEIFRGPVVSGGHDNAQKARRVMQTLMESVPKLLKKMESSDFLPYPCLHIVEEETEEVIKGRKEEKGKEERHKDDYNHLYGNREESYNEDEEEEEEEEEDGDGSNQNTLEPLNFAESVKYTVPPINGSEKLLTPLGNDFTFRLNPLVRIITSKDLFKFTKDGKNDGKNNGKNDGKNDGGQISRSRDKDKEELVCIVHSSFGNETFESVLRQPLVISYIMVESTHILLDLFKEQQVERVRNNKEMYIEDEERVMTSSATSSPSSNMMTSSSATSPSSSNRMTSSSSDVNMIAREDKNEKKRRRDEREGSESKVGGKKKDVGVRKNNEEKDNEDVNLSMYCRQGKGETCPRGNCRGYITVHTILRRIEKKKTEIPNFHFYVLSLLRLFMNAGALTMMEDATYQ